jgi:hypothetical protein
MTVRKLANYLQVARRLNQSNNVLWLSKVLVSLAKVILEAANDGVVSPERINKPSFVEHDLHCFFCGFTDNINKLYPLCQWIEEDFKFIVFL